MEHATNPQSPSPEVRLPRLRGIPAPHGITLPHEIPLSGAWRGPLADRRIRAVMRLLFPILNHRAVAPTLCDSQWPSPIVRQGYETADLSGHEYTHAKGRYLLSELFG